MFETSYSDSYMDAGCECAPRVRSANRSSWFWFWFCALAPSYIVTSAASTARRKTAKPTSLYRKISFATMSILERQLDPRLKLLNFKNR